jgi:hypothetical protein
MADHKHDFRLVGVNQANLGGMKLRVDGPVYACRVPGCGAIQTGLRKHKKKRRK